MIGLQASALPQQQGGDERGLVRHPDHQPLEAHIDLIGPVQDTPARRLQRVLRAGARRIVRIGGQEVGVPLPDPAPGKALPAHPERPLQEPVVREHLQAMRRRERPSGLDGAFQGARVHRRHRGRSEDPGQRGGLVATAFG